MADAEHWLGLGAALAVGLVIGLERGWWLRQAAEGHRVAGVRTIALIALSGGVAGLIAAHLGVVIVVAVFLVLGVLLLLGYRRTFRRNGDAGITTEVSSVLAFLLGVLATTGYPLPAIAGGVITALLLGTKPGLHALMHQLDGPEVRAILQLALISAVILPLLPAEGYGPWNALNPYEIWLMVVLISAIGFSGHFAVRLMGPRRGVLYTGLFAGLASSTALTLALSRAGRDQPRLQPLFAGAVAIASTTMFPRILLLVGLVSPALLPALYLPIGLLTVAGLLGVAWLVSRAPADAGEQGHPPMHRPFELATALRFGVFLVGIVLLAEAFRRWAGDAGIYLLAAISGLSDVDAITLSLGRMAGGDLTPEVAARGIVLAAIANTLVKLGLAVVIARGQMGRLLALALGAVALVGLGWVVWGTLA
ncbi:DUF4010 domain-containing protein [Spiribacter sp. 2438]|uniref:MgtC/SapB family protein n=1 Tax=Spiribacter sp. 2438 TaxID=2666185 RepID=UPI0012B125FA|nr:MgtC/SapB family protein [Spiribacter sp. 2438]QGM21553.1 DUF4010 domain-containing protein [Spiribacter sp. 2438]